MALVSGIGVAISTEITQERNPNYSETNEEWDPQMWWIHSKIKSLRWNKDGGLCGNVFAKILAPGGERIIDFLPYGVSRCCELTREVEERQISTRDVHEIVDKSKKGNSSGVLTRTKQSRIETIK